MTGPAQTDFLDALTRAVVEEIAAEDAAAPFQFDAGGPECEPRSLDEVPPFLRFPDEPGFVELDRNMMPVKR